MWRFGDPMWGLPPRLTAEKRYSASTRKWYICSAKVWSCGRLNAPEPMSSRSGCPIAGSRRGAISAVRASTNFPAISSCPLSALPRSEQVVHAVGVHRRQRAREEPPPAQTLLGFLRGVVAEHHLGRLHLDGGELHQLPRHLDRLAGPGGHRAELRAGGRDADR